LKKALDNAGISVKDWANNLSGAIQGISSLGMTISSIKGLMDTIKDPGTSNWEKFAMILTSISMIASSIGGTITGMKDAWKLIKDITNKQTIE
jgi:hypothetical protein